jgi:predicted kinase
VPTTLIVIRGNSGSGKSTVAREVRLRFGRGCALVEQDYLRRKLLREHESVQEPISAELIGLTTRFALHHGYHAILEGILDSKRYGTMIAELQYEHAGPTHLFYLDVTLAETLRRHETRPQAAEFGGDLLRSLYQERDLLGLPGERVVPESSTQEETIAFISGVL